MTIIIIQLIVLFIVPVFIHNALRDRSISRWISPVVACYIIGIGIGSLLVPKLDADIAEKVKNLSIEIEGIVIVLAIPLLLMTSNFMKWLPKAKSVLGAFTVSCISVLLGSVIAFFIYRGMADNGWLISSMLFAGFTGTNANLNSLGIALNCPEHLKLLINLGDIFTGAIYLIILTSIAHPLLSKILPKYQQYTSGLLFVDERIAPDLDKNEKEDFSYMSVYKMGRAGFYLLPVVLTILALGISIGLEMVLYPAEGMNGTFVILSVTTIGIIMSFAEKIRNLKSSYRIGQYLLLVFCIALGSHIDVASIFSEGSFILIYTTVVMLFTIFFNVLLAYLFKIDADTTLIASTSTIFGPAFIGQVAMSMKNKEIIFSGMIASMLGIAISNFTGLGLAYLLKML
ncbi:MAG: DUF819 family protein [Bacteroidetes bacterium]|nr:DUF819 family protein [Bacteroidota bacterium]